MKKIIGIFALLLLVSCASTWVDPRLNLRSSRITVECLTDPLGLGPKIENLLNEAGVGTKPVDSTNVGDLVLKVEYSFKRSDSGLNTIQKVKAVMTDGRYHSVEARYQWDGQGDSQNDAAQKLVDALVGR
jgi:hypothetical protein